MAAGALSASTPLLRRRLAIVAVALLGVFGAGVLLAVISFPFVFRVVRIEGKAMSPTLRDQDRAVVNKLAYRGKPPQRGDIVMLRYPLEPSRLFVKRVIAQGGDRLEIRSGRVFVDDRPYDEPYVLPEHRSFENWGPQVVPDGYYFVMGDRRNNSSDSRHWGFVPTGYILGRVTFRWWPPADARRY